MWGCSPRCWFHSVGSKFSLHHHKQKNPKFIIFEDLKVPCGNLDPAYKTMLMDLSLSLDAWRSLFVVLKALRDNGGGLVTEEDVNCKKAEVATPLKTPGT
jgi:hypothetical protein